MKPISGPSLRSVTTPIASCHAIKGTLPRVTSAVLRPTEVDGVPFVASGGTGHMVLGQALHRPDFAASFGEKIGQNRRAQKMEAQYGAFSTGLGPCRPGATSKTKPMVAQRGSRKCKRGAKRNCQSRASFGGLAQTASKTCRRRLVGRSISRMAPPEAGRTEIRAFAPQLAHGSGGAIMACRRVRASP